MRSTCPGLNDFLRPRPEFIPCPNCGANVEIWTDEKEAECPNCGIIVSRNIQSCLDWCEYAEKCRKIIVERKGGTQ